ncbi:MAG: four helix bundle protein [Bacteroidetes bacterium]|nr:four helix bundle protein [Bacteroidota bacterium]
MKSDNLIQIKTYNFALRIVKLYRHLVEEKKEFVLSKQVLKSGTSIGANVEEALGGQSRADFTSKLAVAYKEARETNYWIRILRDSEYITAQQAKSILDDIEEILRIIAKIQITTKKNNP